ncbi:MAG: type III pantothenate kinase [Candidatus Omnitrophica bacterium]|nr:type III pantothenate kinase [Candidatus Omnitrophota bacterium]
MIILIDVGNTNTAVAAAEGESITKKYFLRTSRMEISPGALKRLLGERLEKAEEAVVVSVVPDFLALMVKSLRRAAPGIKIIVVGKDIRVPMDVKYEDPSEVGQDRLVAAYAAWRMYSGPVLVVDFGTAVTFDLVGSAGAYEGGLIFPGMRLSLGALSGNAAMLPGIELDGSVSLPGRNTRGSMNSGAVLGYAAMCDGVISRFKAKYGNGLKVVATGGDARLIAAHTENISLIDDDLIFKGLAELAFI